MPLQLNASCLVLEDRRRASLRQAHSSTFLEGPGLRDQKSVKTMHF